MTPMTYQQQQHQLLSAVGNSNNTNHYDESDYDGTFEFVPSLINVPNNNNKNGIVADVPSASSHNKQAAASSGIAAVTGLAGTQEYHTARRTNNNTTKGGGGVILNKVTRFASASTPTTTTNNPHFHPRPASDDNNKTASSSSSGSTPKSTFMCNLVMIIVGTTFLHLMTTHGGGARMMTMMLGGREETATTSSTMAPPSHQQQQRQQDLYECQEAVSNARLFAAAVVDRAVAPKLENEAASSFESNPTIANNNHQNGKTMPDVDKTIEEDRTTPSSTSTGNGEDRPDNAEDTDQHQHYQTHHPSATNEHSTFTSGYQQHHTNHRQQRRHTANANQYATNRFVSIDEPIECVVESSTTGITSRVVQSTTARLLYCCVRTSIKLVRSVTLVDFFICALFCFFVHLFCKQHKVSDYYNNWRSNNDSGTNKPVYFRDGRNNTDYSGLGNWKRQRMTYDQFDEGGDYEEELRRESFFRSVPSSPSTPRSSSNNSNTNTPRSTTTISDEDMLLTNEMVWEQARVNSNKNTFEANQSSVASTSSKKGAVSNQQAIAKAKAKAKMWGDRDKAKLNISSSRVGKSSATPSSTTSKKKSAAKQAVNNAKMWGDRDKAKVNASSSRGIPAPSANNTPTAKSTKKSAAKKISMAQAKANAKAWGQKDKRRIDKSKNSKK